MTYYIKRCQKCGTENHPSDVVCRQCGVMLPLAKTASETPPFPPHQEGPPTDKPAAPTQATQPTARAVIVGLDIGFIDLLWLCTKIILAALPAIMLAAIIVSVPFIFIGAFGRLGGWLAKLFLA